MPTLICVTPELEKMNLRSLDENCNPQCNPDDDSSSSSGPYEDTCWPD